MLDYRLSQHPVTNEEYIETSLAGKPLLTTPQLNKGTAFSVEERLIFRLLGKLPPYVESLEQQTQRVLQQYLAYSTDLQRHIYLNNLHDTNQTLFYNLVSQHLDEMMPLIYTPIVGVGVKEYSLQFRRPRGLFIAYPYRDKIEEILDNRTNPNIDLIVVTDGEAILGIGDQGIGGMDIPIAKLMVYTLLGGIDPTHTLPIQLDVGTNNSSLLADPLYLGWRNQRIRGQEYDDFIERFLKAVKIKFPQVFLHWEDLAVGPARSNLQRSRNNLCSFNDDIQGTGAVAVASLLAAVQANGSTLEQQRIIIFGAGTAGTGVADALYTALLQMGVSPSQARQQFWLLDKPGLLHIGLDNLHPAQTPYARQTSELTNWQRNASGSIDLLETIKQIKPTVLFGCSSVANAFHEDAIKQMAKHIPHPIILPLSNPTQNCEATPHDLIRWTDGKALIATGSPFAPVNYHGKIYPIAQCNNAYIFPGIGLGVLASKATQLSDGMLWAASKTLSQFAPILKSAHGALLPGLTEARQVAQEIAIAVAKQAQLEGLSSKTEDMAVAIATMMWQPHYVPYQKLHLK
ncbi:NAD-dependent malic enzyme [soil metagenome]